jgi:hypothetical protein
MLCDQSSLKKIRRVVQFFIPCGANGTNNRYLVTARVSLQSRHINSRTCDRRYWLNADLTKRFAHVFFSSFGPRQTFQKPSASGQIELATQNLLNRFERVQQSTILDNSIVFELEEMRRQHANEPTRRALRKAN